MVTPKELVEAASRDDRGSGLYNLLRSRADEIKKEDLNIMLQEYVFCYGNNEPHSILIKNLKENWSL